MQFLEKEDEFHEYLLEKTSWVNARFNGEISIISNTVARIHVK